MPELIIAGRRIADEAPAYVVAELGSNHGGDVRVAQQLVRASAEAGASAVKLQKKSVNTLYSSALLAQPYANEHSFGSTYGEHKRALELDAAGFAAVNHTALTCGVPWFATAFDEASVAFLVSFGVPAFKVHSGGLTDRPLLQCLARLGLPVLLSTGGGTLADIDQAVRWLGNCPHAILHCTASYPLLPEHANLRVILSLRFRYPDTVIGFSSHAPGIALSLVAYALGARIIEHHVTLSRAGKGTDHGFSLEPKGLATLVDDLEKARIAMGTGVKIFDDLERAPIAKMRRVETPNGWQITGA